MIFLVLFLFKGGESSESEEDSFCGLSSCSLKYIREKTLGG